MPRATGAESAGRHGPATFRDRARIRFRRSKPLRPPVPRALRRDPQQLPVVDALVWLPVACGRDDGITGRKMASTGPREREPSRSIRRNLRNGRSRCAEVALDRRMGVQVAKPVISIVDDDETAREGTIDLEAGGSGRESRAFLSA